MKTHSTLFSPLSTVSRLAHPLVALEIASSLLAAPPLAPPIGAQASLKEVPISMDLELALDPEAPPIEAQASLDGVPIPTSLVLPLDPQGRPSPVCSQCRITTKTAPSAGSDAAFTSFTFANEVGEGFEGSVTIKVSLVNNSPMTLYETSLSLDDGETHIFELHSDPYHFAWADVAMLSIALSPAM